MSNDVLKERLHRILEQGLYREIRSVASPQGPRIVLEGREVLNFSSNDYLGLADHPKLKEASRRAVDEFGAGSGASRLICGSLKPQEDLEGALASFKDTEAALTFSSGYATALGTIPALVGRDDIVIIDKLVHACLVDAVRLSGAKLRVCRHNDLDHLESLLKWADEQRSSDSQKARPEILVVTESIFSMDGDLAPLKSLTALKERYGAWLMVDEAHATGLYGKNRRGLIEAEGVSNQVEIQMGTLGKALGASGGYICGSHQLIDYLINRARTLIFSTAPVPAASAAAHTGIRLVQSEEGHERCHRLWENVACFKGALRPKPESTEAENHSESGEPPPWRLPRTDHPIVPVILGDEGRTMAMAKRLLETGIFTPGIRYPTVPRRQARLRVTLSSDHSAEDLDRLTAALRRQIS